jgi:hypothetical protein
MDDGINSQYIDEWRYNTVSSIFRSEIRGGIWSLTGAVSLFSSIQLHPLPQSPLTAGNKPGQRKPSMEPLSHRLSIFMPDFKSDYIDSMDLMDWKSTRSY